MILNVCVRGGCLVIFREVVSVIMLKQHACGYKLMPFLEMYKFKSDLCVFRCANQAYVHKSVMEELKRIIDDSEITKEDDALWPPPDRVGRQVCDLFITPCPPSYCSFSYFHSCHADFLRYVAIGNCPRRSLTIPHCKYSLCAVVKIFWYLR